MTDTGAADVGTSASKSGGGKNILIGVIVVLVLAVAGLGYALVGQHHGASLVRATKSTEASGHQATFGNCHPCDGSGSSGSSATTTTGQSATDAVLSVLPAFFSNGCNGGCADLTVPTSAFTATLDSNDSDWIMWTVQDPSIGSASGFAEYITGGWQVVAGPGSDDVGCSSPGEVPSAVLSDFGQTCPSDSSSSSGSTSTATAQSAYQDGYARGQTASAGFVSGGESEQTACRAVVVPPADVSAGLSGDWLSGCENGFASGESSNPSPSSPDVPAYSGGTSGGATDVPAYSGGSYSGDDATGGFSGAP
jgi:hypothetical protein